MIPTLIHQTFKTKQLPRAYARLHRRVKDLHPGWEVRLWDDRENRALVAEHVPEMLALYDGFAHPIMRVDFVRYLYMRVFGGFYFDLDYELRQPLDQWCGESPLLLPISRGDDDQRSEMKLGNCAFGSAPGQLFWQDLMAALAADPPPPDLPEQRIEVTTGPEFVTGVYLKDPDRYPALLPARELFHPTPEDMERDADAAVGFHHCFGEWRHSGAKGLPKRLAKRIVNRILSPPLR